MKTLHIETIHGKRYVCEVANSLEAAKLLANLQRLGILCRKWWYEKEGT
jgi:hypothetical protein